MKTWVKNKIIDLIPTKIKNGILEKFKQSVGLADGSAKLSYAQQAEDLHIERYFGNKPIGFFVDVGAFDPISLSNTYLFYRKGWRGMNIEPNPDAILRFQKLRPLDLHVQAAVGDTNQQLRYYVFNYPAVNSFSEEHVAKWKQQAGFEVLQEILIDTISLESILEQHLPAHQTIDFLTIDTEQWDLKVLHSNNWQRFRPTLVLVEVEMSENLASNAVYQFMQSVDYRLWAITGGSWIFERVR